MEELGIQARLKKFCVFCGKMPVAQNKEHIIPEWLIKLTGDLNRTITIGRQFYGDPSQIIKFSFNSLVFPSCEKCNGEFSRLEEVSKGIVTGQPLAKIDANSCYLRLTFQDSCGFHGLYGWPVTKFLDLVCAR